LDVKKGEGSYVLVFADFSEAMLKGGSDEKRLDNARDGAVTSAKGKLKAEKRITLDKHPGRELHIEVEGKTAVRTRFYAVKNRLYQVLAVGTRELVFSKDTDRFLDSFKLTR